MIRVLRILTDCVYGQGYGLLVDLHVLLDMAQKICCDDQLLEDWARDVEIDERVLDYYRGHRAVLDRDLSCAERRSKGMCGLLEVVRFVRGHRQD